jgi:hypothetical protein
VNDQDHNAKRFQLVRNVDVTGVSGTGVVADGVLWPDGTVTIRWRGDRPSTVNWGHLDHAVAVHGHGGQTRIAWLDVYPSADYASAWTELRGYVQQADDDGGQINPVDLLTYMDELKQRALAPVGDWLKSMIAAGPTGETGGDGG